MVTVGRNVDETDKRLGSKNAPKSLASFSNADEIPDVVGAGAYINLLRHPQDAENVRNQMPSHGASGQRQGPGVDAPRGSRPAADKGGIERIDHQDPPRGGP
jgi:hypothetical protein